MWHTKTIHSHRPHPLTSNRGQPRAFGSTATHAPRREAGDGRPSAPAPPPATTLPAAGRAPALRARALIGRQPVCDHRVLRCLEQPQHSRERPVEVHREAVRGGWAVWADHGRGRRAHPPELDHFGHPARPGFGGPERARLPRAVRAPGRLLGLRRPAGRPIGRGVATDPDPVADCEPGEERRGRDLCQLPPVIRQHAACTGTEVRGEAGGAAASSGFKREEVESGSGAGRNGARCTGRRRGSGATPAGRTGRIGP